MEFNYDEWFTKLDKTDLPIKLWLMLNNCSDFRKDRKSQTYVNETFMTGSASNTLGNLNVDSRVENMYSRLDNNAIEDRTTYESLRP
jgi:hypothetical protein